jgi:hypothetical protein
MTSQAAAIGLTFIRGFSQRRNYKRPRPFLPKRAAKEESGRTAKLSIMVSGHSQEPERFKE